MTTFARRRAELVWLAIVALPLLLLKGAMTGHRVGVGVDGGYYAEVARHVRDGEGLVTNVSLYGFSYPSFPHPTTIYPIWPWILGNVLRVLPEDVAFGWLPAATYVTSLGAAWLAGRRLAGEPWLPRWVPGFHGGHALVLLLGLHREYLVFTSLPYSEGIAWTLFWLWAWRLARPGALTSLAGAAEMGAWAAVLYLVRSQMMLVGLGLVAGLGVRVIVGPDRRGWLGRVLVTAGVAALLVLPYAARLHALVPELGVSGLLRFDQHRVGDIFPELAVLKADAGLVALAKDRWGGVRLAFGMHASQSYFTTFGYAPYALPFALPVVLAALWRAARGGGVLAALRRPGSTPWIVLVAVATGGFLSIHLAHKVYYGEWYFHRRHALVCLPLFWLALVALGRARWAVARGVALGLVLGTTVHAWEYTPDMVRRGGESRRLVQKATDARALAGWLNARREAEGPFTVIAVGDLAQELGWQTRDIGYHWVPGGLARDALVSAMDQLGARYLVYPRGSTDLALLEGGVERLHDAFVSLPDEPGRARIWRRGEAEAPARGAVVWLQVEGGAALAPMPTLERLARDGAATVRVAGGERAPADVVTPARAGAYDLRVHVLRAAGTPGPDPALDAAIATLAATVPQGATLVVSVAPRAKEKGALYLLGPAVRAGARLDRARQGDVAPTIAWLLGMPIAEDVGGAPLVKAFVPAFVAARPALRVGTWGAAITEGAGAPDDER